MDHTIILLTRNRVNWLKYNLSFYFNYKYKGTILIADDSDSENSEKIKSLLKNYDGKLNLEYFSGPSKESNNRTLRVNHSRFAAIKKINTKFYSQAGDDDFFIPSSLSKAVSFLEKNPDYVSISGINYQVEMNNQYQIDKIFSAKWRTCTLDDPLDRLSHYAIFKGLPNYSVLRTSHLDDLISQKEKNFFLRDESQVIDSFDEEITWNAQVYISGKLGRLENDAMFFRCKSEDPDRIENLFQNKLSEGNVKYIFDGRASNALKLFFEELFILIKSKGTSYSDENIKYILKQFIWNFFCLNFHGDGFLKIKTKFKEKYQNVKVFKLKISINKFLNLPFLVCKIFNFFIAKLKGCFLICNFKKFHNKNSHYLLNKTI